MDRPTDAELAIEPAKRPRNRRLLTLLAVVGAFALGIGGTLALTGHDGSEPTVVGTELTEAQQDRLLVTCLNQPEYTHAIAKPACASVVESLRKYVAENEGCDYEDATRLMSGAIYDSDTKADQECG